MNILSEELYIMDKNMERMMVTELQEEANALKSERNMIAAIRMNYNSIIEPALRLQSLHTSYLIKISSLNLLFIPLSFDTHPQIHVSFHHRAPLSIS